MTADEILARMAETYAGFRTYRDVGQDTTRFSETARFTARSTACRSRGAGADRPPIDALGRLFPFPAIMIESDIAGA